MKANLLKNCMAYWEERKQKQPMDIVDEEK